jgi:hypothetical protein
MWFVRSGFDLEEEPLDEVAFAVERIIAGDLWGCLSGWNDGHGTLMSDRVAKGGCVAPLSPRTCSAGRSAIKALACG